MSVPEKSSTATARGFAKSRCLCEIHRVTVIPQGVVSARIACEARIDATVEQRFDEPAVAFHEFVKGTKRSAFSSVVRVQEQQNRRPEVKFALLF